MVVGGASGNLPINSWERFPLTQFLPKNINFVKNKSYKFEMTLPASVWLYACPNTTVFSDVISKCVQNSSRFSIDYTLDHKGVGSTVTGTFIPRFSGKVKSAEHHGQFYILSQQDAVGKSIYVKLTE